MKRTRLMTIYFNIHPVFGLARAISLLETMRDVITRMRPSISSRNEPLPAPLVKIETTYGDGNANSAVPRDGNAAAVAVKMHIMFI